ncbi:MAG: glycoside hydrolase 43 family protein [Lachnospiraceae bacterium]|nr:glycoside hydrolase 43 family protein [Lachnospiraceae bacterium]
MPDIVKNPVINADFPDPDVIRVGEYFYMTSTTMFLMPGADILRSRDLAHWEIIGHVFDLIGDEDEYTLSNGKHAYARGMWAPSLTYNKGKFYLNFACNERKRSLLYIADDPRGPWERTEMGDFYYDSSLFFDEDDKVYIVHGNSTLRLTQLDPATWGPKEGGIDRILAVDEKDQPLGYEGSHLYRLNDRYYLFSCHMPKETQGRKTEVCFISDSLTGEFKVKTILNDCMGYNRPALQVAQGGMVDDTNGRLYMFMFHDRGALGRAPVIFPMRFGEDGYPMPDTPDGSIPDTFAGVPGVNGGYMDMRDHIYGDDSFAYDSIDEMLKTSPWWQISHNPDEENIGFTKEEPGLFIRTSKVTDNLLQARNTLTQRCMGPKSEGEIVLDASGLKVGDCAGLCIYSSHYGAIAVTRDETGYKLVRLETEAVGETIMGDKDFYTRKPQIETICELSDPVVRLRVKADFTKEPDTCTYSYKQGDKWIELSNVHKLYFRLDMFIGARFGLFAYSTKQTGGCAVFRDFRISPM